MSTGLFVGRFQPFHKGHKKAIESIIDDVDEIVVAVGSADSSHTTRNPFTAGERIRMVEDSLTDYSEVLYTVPIVDIDRNTLWVQHVESLTPRFDTVFTNNDLVARLFKEASYDVTNHEVYDRDQLSGTEVRERIVNGREWRDLVTDETIRVIERIDGTERLRDLSPE